MDTRRRLLENKTNKEINDALQGADIVKFTKSP
jgi:hypothetical protein